MIETGDQGDPASHRPGETGDDPSAMVRPPAMRPRGTYVSKSDMVTDVIRDLITDGLLPPGTPLRQRVLAEQFDVSYTPVREALRRLESEGLVVTDVHRGATVARTESEMLQENYRILAALETLAGSLATDRRCPAVPTWSLLRQVLNAAEDVVADYGDHLLLISGF